MNKLLVLACAAAGVISFSAATASAAEPVTALPAVVHINQTVVVETGHRRYHRHHYYRRHHRGYYYRHHRRYHY